MHAFLLIAVIATCSNSYKLIDDYSSNRFFDKFNFFTEQDPTNGFVKYVDRKTAENAGLVKVNEIFQINAPIQLNNNKVYVGVDTKNRASSGRMSVRLESKNQYTHGLFILDLDHMPGSICGTWPAFW